MKKLILFTMTIFIAEFSFSQEKKIEKQTTQAEQFSSQSGTLIEKQFVDIGKVKGISIQIMKIKDLNSGVSKTALRFEFEYKSSYTSDTKISTLDLDELDGLLKSMENLQKNVFITTKDVYTEVTFRSRTGFEAGAFYDNIKQKWSSFIKLERFDSNSMVFLNTEDFSNILEFVKKAKEKMHE